MTFWFVTFKLGQVASYTKSVSNAETEPQLMSVVVSKMDNACMWVGATGQLSLNCKMVSNGTMTVRPGQLLKNILILNVSETSWEMEVIETPVLPYAP